MHKPTRNVHEFAKNTSFWFRIEQNNKALNGRTRLPNIPVGSREAVHKEGLRAKARADLSPF
jgi:hypothetical protein